MPGKKSKGERQAELMRKRDKIAQRRERRHGGKQSYFDDDDTYQSFAKQLHMMGLALREIPGDGNCLFRALDDQLEGNSNKHMFLRLETSEYMARNRKDFEPFIEDDMPFERYIVNLRKPGTYAGNDAIVAFARKHCCNVVIHQLNKPLYQIIGAEHPSTRELHISYHNGDHYSSVRRIGDNSDMPANIKLVSQNLEAGMYGDVEKRAQKSKANKAESRKKESNCAEAAMDFVDFTSNPVVAQDMLVNGNCLVPGDLHGHTIYPDESGEVKAVRDVSDVESFIMQETSNTNVEEVSSALKDNMYDVDSTIAYLLQLRALRDDSSTRLSTPTDYQEDSGNSNGNIDVDEGAVSMAESASIASEKTVSDSSLWSSADSSGSGQQLRSSPGSTSLSATSNLQAEQDTWSRTSSGYSSQSSATGAIPKIKSRPHLSNKQRKAEAKLERKKMAEERHRNLNNNTTIGEDVEDTQQLAMVREISCLKI